MTRYERCATGTHTPVRGAVLCAMLALTMGGLATLHASTAEAAIGIDIDIAPPADRVVVAPPPRAGFVWAPGYWFWNGNTHVWREGRWMRERHGYHWVPDAWVARGPHYHYVRGHWAH